MRVVLQRVRWARVTVGKDVYYPLDDVQKDKLLATLGDRKMEISRFKGLGEMPAKVLKDTTMNKAQRSLLKVVIRPGEDTQLVDRLMGKKAEERFLFIQENAPYVKNLDI